MTDTELKCRNAKEAAKKLSTASANDKNKALLLIAEELKSNKDYILRENDKDMKAAEENGLPKVLLDRLLLSPDRIDGMAKGVIEVADLPDPALMIPWAGLLTLSSAQTALKSAKFRCP